jgi:phosphohistidine swiveling domain-containing protein
MSASTWFGDSTLSTRYPAWTRGNAADVFPDPFTPLGQSLVLRQGMGRGLRDAYISIGVVDWDEIDDAHLPDLFKMFGGYLYNPLTLTRVLGARMPGASPEMIDKAFFDEGADVPPYEAQPWHESERHGAKLGETMAWTMSTDSLPALDADRNTARQARAMRPDLTALTDAALLARAHSMVPLLQQMFENAMIVSSMASLGPGALSAICEGLGDASMAIQLLAGVEVDSAEPPKAMWRLGRSAAASTDVSAAFDAGVDGVLERLATSPSPAAVAWLAEFGTFLDTYGARAQNEYDVISLAWELEPRIALAAIDLMRRADADQDPTSRRAAAVTTRDRLVADIRAQLADDPDTLGTFDVALRSAQLFLAGRERAKTNAVIVIHEIRMALWTLARRWTERGLIDTPEHLFMLTDAELAQARHHPDGVGALTRDRWATYRSLFDREPLFVVNGRVPGLAEMPLRNRGVEQPVAVGDVLKGGAGSGGVATGRARVVLDAGDPLGLEPGEVLIAPQTDPSWVPLFVPAEAVIVNVGAMGSHAMIVSRELGIPCVVAIADATRRIPDGALVQVDGSSGTVTIVELPG